MPKATVDEDNGSVFRQNYVRFARQIPNMKPVAVA